MTSKIFGIVTLAADGEKNGEVLLSYMMGPFTLAHGEFFTDPHTNYWECAEIARLFLARGYDVDAINADNTDFIPQKPYTAVIDIKQNLKRLVPLLPPSCKKVMHITSSFGAFQNGAEQERLDNLYKRRGVKLSQERKELDVDNPKYADFLEGFGNKTVHATYSQFNKTIYPIPISVSQTFDFPEGKDFAKARSHFLFFGGGGAILKGLDLVIEAFASLPHLNLHIVGPASYEKGFSETYAKELALPNIFRYPRPRIDKDGIIKVDGKPFIEILNQCASIIYPSASEGTSGAVIQAMHAGVIPIITKETGISEEASSFIINEPTVESVRGIVQGIADMLAEKLKAKSHLIWEYARKHHTKETFSRAYGDFIDNILNL